MSFSSPNAGMQASAPLVDGIVNHVLLQSSPDLNQSLSHGVHMYGHKSYNDINNINNDIINNNDNV